GLIPPLVDRRRYYLRRFSQVEVGGCPASVRVEPALIEFWRRKEPARSSLSTTNRGLVSVKFAPGKPFRGMKTSDVEVFQRERGQLRHSIYEKGDRCQFYIGR